jgi:peptidoglycan-associated lipoprotein
LGENLMRFSYVICALAGLALAACESSPEVNSSATGDGSSSGAASQSGTGGPVTSGVTSQQVTEQAPGSAEDFVINVGDRVLFGLNRFDLSPVARTTVENQVIWLKRFPSVTITVEGHADERGTREYNLALGERRANSLRDYMIALGVDPNRVKTLSFGKERPVDPASNEEAWSRNRRAVTVVDGVTG